MTAYARWVTDRQRWGGGGGEGGGEKCVAKGGSEGLFEAGAAGVRAVGQKEQKRKEV